MPKINFEARQLPSYAEHYPMSRLRQGEIYFRVYFYDPKLLVPQLDPVVFIGRDLAIGDSGTLYFQDLDSHSKGSRFGAPTEVEPTVIRSLGHQSSGVFDYERALDELLRCSLRRREGGTSS